MHLPLGLETQYLTLTYLSSSIFLPKDNKNDIGLSAKKKGIKTWYLERKNKDSFINLKFHVGFFYLKYDWWQHKNKHWETFIRTWFIRKEYHHLSQRFSVHKSLGVTNSQGRLSACNEENVCISHYPSSYCDALLSKKSHRQQTKNLDQENCLL